MKRKEKLNIYRNKKLIVYNKAEKFNTVGIKQSKEVKNKYLENY